MKPLNQLDPDKHVLGRLCKYGHDWDNTGQSARYKHNSLCIICKRENHKHRVGSDIEYAERKRKQNLLAQQKRYATNPEYCIGHVVASNRRRLESDPYHALVSRLRSRVRRAFNEYTLTGKVRTSKDYGIDYDAIIHHLGPCPGNRDDYHIDHIIALSRFDLNDPLQVKEAFAPSNHQWLTIAENIKKGNK